MARRHGLRVDPAWVSATPGVVSGLGLILQAVSAPGDEVVVFPPAYHAFRRIILANERRILDAQLVETDGRYAMDLDALRAKLTPRTKVVFFCSPHNPGGTVWSVDEIRALAAFCAEHDLILVSDEIHCDLLFDGAKHTPAIVAAPEIADRLITCVAATKTFNLAGAHVGACITSNAALKRRIDARIMASGLGSYNAFGMIATEAAWRTGEAWLDALLPYLAESRDLFDARIEAAAPGARSMRLDGTYLAWVDFSGTGLPPEEVAARVKSRARIFASPGSQFGPGGESGYASTSPRRARSSRRRSAGWRTRSGICGRADESGDDETRGRCDCQRASRRESIYRSGCRGKESSRGCGRRRRPAADVCELAGYHRYRRAAGGGRRRVADGRTRQRASDPFQDRAASRA